MSVYGLNRFTATQVFVVLKKDIYERFARLNVKKNGSNYTMSLTDSSPTIRSLRKAMDVMWIHTEGRC